MIVKGFIAGLSSDAWVIREAAVPGAGYGCCYGLSYGGSANFIKHGYMCPWTNRGGFTAANPSVNVFLGLDFGYGKNYGALYGSILLPHDVTMLVAQYPKFAKSTDYVYSVMNLPVDFPIPIVVRNPVGGTLMEYTQSDFSPQLLSRAFSVHNGWVGPGLVEV